MARRADSYADLFHCGACHESVSAGACNFAFLICGVNVFLHGVEILLVSQAEALNQRTVAVKVFLHEVAQKPPA